MNIQRYKQFIKESNDPDYKSLDDEMSILKELSLDLTDNGLEVSISEEDTKSGNICFLKRWPTGAGEPHSLYLVISDDKQVFCKKWPEDDSDWLFGKPIITKFLQNMDEFGFKRSGGNRNGLKLTGYGGDYELFGGGLSVTLVFSKKGRKAIKL